MTHHSAMTSSLLIKILKIDKFGVFSSDIDFKTKMDIFRYYISRLINHCHLQATEGSLRRTRSVCQPRSASKRSAFVFSKIGNTVVSIAFNQYGCTKLTRNNFSTIMGQTVGISSGRVSRAIALPIINRGILSLELKLD